MLEAIEAILREELPRDCRYNHDDGTGTAIGKPIVGEIESSLSIELPHRDSATKFSMPLLWARFDVFIYRGKLVTQQLNPQNGIMARIEPHLADPECFKIVVEFIKTRSLLTWSGSSKA